MTRPALLSHLSLRPGDVVSIVGGGGKTTLMYALARELGEAGFRVVITTTTKIFPPQRSESPELVVSAAETFLIEKAQEAFQRSKLVTLAEQFIAPKLKGLAPDLIDRLQSQKIGDIILVEADGARHCPLKAPNETEPVVPLTTTWNLVVLGLDGLGKPNADPYVFRPDYFARLAGIELGEKVTPEAVARVVLHPEGLTRGTPAGARIVLILNKGDLEETRKYAEDLARLILGAHNRSLAKILLTRLQPAPEVLAVFLSPQPE